MRVTQSTIRRRIVILLFCLILCIGALVGRLFYIQAIQGKWLSGLAEQVRNRSIAVQGTRGSILDANGKELAYTATAPSVVVVPVQIKDKPGTARKLSKILDMPYDKVIKRVSKRTKAEFLPPNGKRISEQQANEIQALKLPGVYITEEGKRAYPYGDLAAQVLGITGSDNQGLTGIEKQYDNTLTGEKGYISYMSEASGRRIPGLGDTYTPAVDGEDVQLNLNVQIESFAERELEQAVAEYNPDSALAIVEDPQTGAILAMANYPTFDPANWRAYPAAAYNRNLSIWQTFEPGSTFKIVTLSAAMQENKVNLKDKFYDPGYYEVAGHKIKCWKAGGHGSQSFLNVVENSCNPGFIALGERLGKNTLFQYIKKFGFGTKTGIDLPGEGNGILFKLNKVGPLELATTAFGQGVSVTAIQQVMAMGAIANGGTLMKPEVAKAILNHKTHQVVDAIEPQTVRRVVSPSVDKQVRQALESVVANGSGGNAYVDGYRVAGKTGTAQVAEGGHYANGHYIVSFIGMAPANNPKLVAYVAIDHPRPTKTPVFGGTIVAPIVGRILSDSLSYLDVPKDTSGPSKRKRWTDPIMVAVPNLAGETIGDARRKMIQSGLQLKTQVVGTGKYIVSQAPAAGTKVTEGSTIRLFLGDVPAN